MIKRTYYILNYVFYVFYFFLLLFFVTTTFADSKKEEPGFNWQAYYIGDVFYGASGGLENNTKYLGKIDLRLNFDLEKLMNLKDTTGLFEVENIHGQRPNLYVQSIQGFDSIEYDRLSTMTYLYQLWLQHNFGEHWSILAGFFDLNSEFYVTDSSLYLIAPTYGIGTDIAQTGLNGPSIFPVIGTALRVKYSHSQSNFIEAAIFDASAANPLNAAYSHLPFSTGQGSLIIVELDHLFFDKQNKNKLGKIALGAWGYTHPVDELIEPDSTLTQAQACNRGLYTLIDYPLYISAYDSDRIIHGFLRYGIASTAINLFNRALGAGVTINGFIPGRPDDIISYGLSPAWTSAKSRMAKPGLPIAEWQNEVTYVASIRKWLSLQPDLQYISFPHADRTQYQNAWLIGLRVTLLVG